MAMDEAKAHGMEIPIMVDKLEAMFSKAESEIEYMSRKLENEFQEGVEDKNQTSPLELSNRLEQVKNDYKSVLAEVDALKRAQEEMVEGIKQQLQSAAQAVGRLQHACPDAQVPDTTEQEELVKSLLGIPLTSNHAGPTTSASTSSHHSREKQSSASSDKEEQENLSPVDTTFEIEPSPAELRVQSGDMVPITQEEFQSVSELVRGRAKLDDVNRVYNRLYEHFKTEGKKSALSVQEMSKIGMKITGATGEAKLKTLRTLKIVNITRTGAVKLL